MKKTMQDKFTSLMGLTARGAIVLTVVILGSFSASTLAAPPAQTSPTLSVPADSSRWELQEQASVTEYLGRKSLLLNGGAATVKDFEMRDGVINFDVATTAIRGFFGIQFRLDKDGSNGEWIYLRPHSSGLPDALQ